MRKFAENDLVELTMLLKADPLLHWEEVLDEVRGNSNVWLYDVGKICGLAYIRLAEQETRHFRIQLYVAPTERRKGIGTKLWTAASGELAKMKPNLISTHFAVDNGDPAPFYRQKGFKKWYGCVNLKYEGGIQPESDIEFVPYNDEKHFEQYAHMRQHSFYEMHRDNDIYPYLTPVDGAMRQFIQRQADRTYLAMDGESIMAATAFSGDCLEFLVVSPDYRGRGLGRKAVQFAINSLLEQGVASVNVTSVIGNDRAEGLYRDIGFETVTTYHVYRQFGDR